MSRTTAVQLPYGQAVKLTSSGKLNSNGDYTDIFSLPNRTGAAWSQVTFQSVLDNVSALSVDIECDLSGNDNNFAALASSVDMKANQVSQFNLSGGNARYRLKGATVTTTGTGADIWAIIA